MSMSRQTAAADFKKTRYDLQRMKIRLAIVVAGALVGFLGAVGIYFDPDEPYKHFIVAAGTLSGVVLALLIAAAVDAATPLLPTLLAGAGFGLLYSATTYLAKGGWLSADAPYIVPTGIVSGLVLAPIIRALRK